MGGITQMKDILVKGAERSEHMQWAYRAVQDFIKTDFNLYLDDKGRSPAMKTNVGEKPRFRFSRISYSNSLFTHEEPNYFVVEILPYKKLEGEND
jgi:hypothetical protein